MLNKAKCWRCQSTWNYSSKERCFTEDPELGHRHHECQRLISQIRLDQLQRIFLVRISGQGLTNENADANLYLELFKQLLDEKLEPETSVYYEKYKSFKDSIENALFNNNNYNEQIEMIDPYFMIPEIHGPGQEDDGQESDFDAGNSDSEEDLERTLQNLEISALESSPPPSQQQQQHTPPSQQQQHLPPPPQQQQYPSPPAQQQQQHTPPSQQQQHPPPPPQQPDDAQQQQHPQLHLGRHPPPNIQQQRSKFYLHYKKYFSLQI
uniref:Uncharacterized protein n=1 Tax=Panagrolaimus sp. PS1159 TaxID=55785 RepID=A0AC35GX84_9BILA